MMKQFLSFFIIGGVMSLPVRAAETAAKNNTSEQLILDLHTLQSCLAEPKPASHQNEYKTAAVCFMGFGECDPNVGYGNGGDYSVDTIQQCQKEGFTLQNCGALQEVDGVCPYNPSYGTGCRCKRTLIACNEAQNGVGSSCDGKYEACSCKSGLFTCTDSQDGIGNACEGKYTACSCKDNLVACNEAQEGLGTACSGKYTSCKCKNNLISCNELQDGAGTSCGGKYASCVCKSSLIACTSAQDGIGEACDGKYKSCTCKNNLTNCGNNQVGMGEACGGKYASCQCDPQKNWQTCNKGGENGALSCNLNGTTYWTSCKPELSNEEVCKQKLATHSSAAGYTIYETGKSKSMGKGYIIVGNPTASTLPGTKIFGAPYFSQIPECVVSTAKLTLNPTITKATSTISTVASLEMEKVEIELDPTNNTGGSSMYITGIVIDPGTGTSMNNKLKDVVFSSKMSDYSYYYLKLGYPVTSCPASGACTNKGFNNAALYLYGKVEMKGVGYSMITPSSGPVYVTSGSTFELDGAQFSGRAGGQIKINNGTMKIRYLSIGAENTKLANGTTESILIIENNGSVYASDKLLIDSQGTTRLEMRSGGKAYARQYGLRLGPEILIKGSNSGLYIWNPETDSTKAVKTTSGSSSQCLLKYSGGGSSVYYGEAQVGTLGNLFKCQ